MDLRFMVFFVISDFRDFVIKDLFLCQFLWVGLGCLVFLDRY